MNSAPRDAWLTLALLALTVTAPTALAQTGALSTLYSFTGGVDGGAPNSSSGFIQGTDGNFYGVTVYGGTNNGGSLYRLNISGSLTTLYSFPETNNPGCGYSSVAWTVLQGTDGSLSGAAGCGGVVNLLYSGTIFNYSSNGTFTTVYADDGIPLYGVIQGSDGNYYGMAPAAGQTAILLYQVTPDGAFTVLHTFACACEFAPTSNGLLLEGAPLTFYGAISDPIDGTLVFSATSAGAVTNLTTLPAGAELGPLTVGPDKAFYGYGEGAVLRLLPDGTWTFLHIFQGAGAGAGPQGSPVFGPDGTLYGFTTQGGKVGPADCTALGCGTIFAISPAGAFSIVYEFTDGEDSVYPTSLIVGKDGALYGTTTTGGNGSGGGTYHQGSVFQIKLSSPAPPPPPPGGGSTGGGGSLDFLSLLALILTTGNRIPQRAAETRGRERSRIPALGARGTLYGLSLRRALCAQGRRF